MDRVAIVGGVRTPFVRAGGAFARYSFLDLGIHTVRALVARLGIAPGEIDELVYGSVLVDPRVSNFAREIILRTELPDSINAHSVSNNCISGLVAVTMIAESIAAGRISVGIAGGSESMSRPTLTFPESGERFFLSLFRARSLGEKLKILSTFRPGMLVPQPPSPKEPSTGKTMGQHCEMMAKEFKIGREIQDQIALASHTNAARAQSEGILGGEIAALGGVEKDNLIRADTSLEKLAKLKPVFDRSENGTITAGNSSALTDGASAVCLMSESAAKRLNREILGFVDGIEFSAVDPKDGLLMAPGLALPKLMHKHGLTVGQIDRFEIHEAFGAQVAANMQVWERGWSKYPQLKPIGDIPAEKINVNGGSIAIGHPFAATGGRLVLALANELQRKRLKRGVISVCAAGAMGCAMLVSAP